MGRWRILMAEHVSVDIEYLEYGLTAIADEIREKKNIDALLSFPDGMVDAIKSIESGANLKNTEIYIADYSISEDIQITAGVIDVWRRCIVS